MSETPCYSMPENGMIESPFRTQTFGGSNYGTNSAPHNRPHVGTAAGSTAADWQFVACPQRLELNGLDLHDMYHCYTQSFIHTQLCYVSISFVLLL